MLHYFLHIEVSKTGVNFISRIEAIEPIETHFNFALLLAEYELKV